MVVEASFIRDTDSPLSAIPIPRGFGLGILEGWESIRVDSEQKPSIVGTGGEDYFSGGFYFKGGAFHTPTHGAITRSFLLGRASAYRFHIDDPIPFEEAVEVCLDHGFNNEMEADISSVAYWYQTEPHKSFSTLPPLDLRHPARPWVNIIQHGILTGIAFVAAVALGFGIWSALALP